MSKPGKMARRGRKPRAIKVEWIAVEPDPGTEQAAAKTEDAFYAVVTGVIRRKIADGTLFVDAQGTVRVAADQTETRPPAE